MSGMRSTPGEQEMAYVTRMPCCGKIVAAAIEGMTPKRDIKSMLSRAKKRGDTVEHIPSAQVNEIGFTTHDHAVGHKDCDGNLTRAGVIAKGYQG